MLIMKLKRLIFFAFLVITTQGLSANENDQQDNTSKQQLFIAGEHYIVLDQPVATRDKSKIEVVEMFSYGCPHCYEFEPLINNWLKQQDSEIDFWIFPAVWNDSMKIFARAFYAAQYLNVAVKIHLPLFHKVVIEQKQLNNENQLKNFFAEYGVDKKAFTEAFNSPTVINQVKQAQARVRNYHPVGVPEIIVNGKYRIERMRAGGYKQMLNIVDFLVKKERLTMSAISLD